MIYFVNAVPYRLLKTAAGWILRKDAVQFDLFGAPVEVPLTRKAKKRESPGQLSLFELPEQPTLKPKRVAKQQRVSKREGERKTENGVTYELKSGHWHRVDIGAEPQTIGGLQVIQDEPATEPMVPVAEVMESPKPEPVEQETPVLRPKRSRKKPVEQPQPDRIPEKVADTNEPIKPQTFDDSPSLVHDADYKAVNGRKRRQKANAEVQQILEDKQSGFTDAELQTLASYSGRGGIGTDDVSLNEYYTRSDIAKFTVDLLYQSGFTGGTLLEPSCGAGVFLKQGDRPDTKVIGVEFDPTSSAVAAAVNPHAEVVPTRFERFCLDNADTSVDAIVGNVPFGVRLTTSDFKANGYKSQWSKNEDLFVDASLDMLAPEGMMALIVPHGVVGGADHMNLRQELVKKGRVLGAYRLPESAFKHSDTSVVTDILLVQKHPTSVLNAIKSGDEAAISATADPNFVGGGYFTANPEHVLGEVGTKKRGDRETLSVKGDINEAILSAAPKLEPVVSYEGLGAIKERKPLLKPGDERFINGKLFRLNENHRWELVDDLNAEQAAITEQTFNPVAYGVDSLQEAEGNLQDAGKRVLLSPDQLPHYLELARSSGMSQADIEAMQNAAIALNHAGGSSEREKLAHAMLLAGHLQILQKAGESDPIELQRALGLLQQYRELYGNPSTDKRLSAIALQFPALLSLQGAFDEAGRISDYFADPESLKVAVDRTAHGTPIDAMGEAFRANGGEPVTIGEVRGYLADTNITDDDLAAALLADPTIGYTNGTYQPINRLLVGNGYDLMAQLGEEAELHPEGSPYRRKLEAQIGEIRARLEPRALEDMTVPLWAVGGWVPTDAFNAYIKDRGYHEIKLTDKGWMAVMERSSSPYSRHADYLTEFEKDVLTSMNRGRISHGINTKEAKEAVARFEEEFRDWLAGSDYRLEVEQNYNTVFNGELVQEFSGEKLEIQNCPNAHLLHDYQNSTIRQMAEQGKGIVSLGVGLGKTATAINLSQHLKQLGRAQKPTVVAPKSVLANWFREIGFWASGANVLVIGQTQQFWGDGSPAWEVPGHLFKMKRGMPERDGQGNYILFHQEDKDRKHPISLSEDEVKKRGNLAFKDDDAATKERKLQQLRQNSYDLVLMSEPVFQAIGLDPEREYDEMKDLMGKHVSDSAGGNQKKLYELQKRKEAKLAQLADRRTDKTENITWESLGIDCLIHDEAHHLKNLFGTMRTGDVAFLSNAESNRALDFYYKSKYTREQNNGQNVFLLTATPTTNNPLEAFNMLQHVCPEEFEQRGIQNVDDFLQMFGKIEDVTVPGVDLELTTKNGLTGFKNLKDLRKLFNKYCRMQSAKDVGLPIPTERSHDVFVDMSDAQHDVYDSLKQRAQELMKQGQNGDRQEGDDHIFSVISDMDKAAIDLAYYDQSKSAYGVDANLDEGVSSPKIQAAAQRVMASHAANGGKQIIFCDAVQLHEGVKQQLIAAGYPEDQIQIVNAQTVPKASDRQKVSQAYNDGRKTLVIGNTATMGEGMNFQIGTTDIHHLTTPWTPAAIEQRNGRGVRQGNKLDEVGVHYYHANQSFDHYRKGVIERKRGWIDDLWKGTEDEMVNQNTGGMSFDEMAIALADDPEAARKSLETNREAQMAKLRQKQQAQSLKQFGQVQTMKMALARMSPERRESMAGKELTERLKQATGALARNEFFPYKSLLDGDNPAYVGTDGTVILPGHHVQLRDGTIARVTGVDISSQKMTAVPVIGPDHNPFKFDDEDQEEISFRQINSTKYDKVKPVEFHDGEKEKRMVAGVRNYGHLRYLSPTQIDSSRPQILKQLREHGSYDRVPHVDPASGDVKIDRLSDVPEHHQVLFPHDGGALDRTLKTWGKMRAEGIARDDWKYKDVVETLSGKTMGYGSDFRKEIEAKVEQYKAEHQANNPKEGDTRTNEAGHREVLRGSRWVRVDDEPTRSPLPEQQPAASTVQELQAKYPNLEIRRESFSTGGRGTNAQGSTVTAYKNGAPIGSINLSVEESLSSLDEKLSRITANPTSPENIEAIVSKYDLPSVMQRVMARQITESVQTAGKVDPDDIRLTVDTLIGRAVRQQLMKPISDDAHEAIVQGILSDLSPKAETLPTQPETTTLPTHDELDAAHGALPQKQKPTIQAERRQTRHAKRGIDLHVVALKDRVDRDKYNALNQKAKSMGGYYSSYKGQGAIPGFQFEDPDLADEFLSHVTSMEKTARFVLSGIPYHFGVLPSGTIGLMKVAG